MGCPKNDLDASSELASRQSQFNGDVVQSLVFRPQLCSRRQLHCREQMSVDMPDPAPEQLMTVDKMENLYIRSDTGSGQVRERVQYNFALTQIAQSEFADDKGVRQDRSRIKQCNEGLVVRP